jgi:hypothetical protein
MARTYVADLPGGTATTTIQCQQKQTFKQATISFVNAAAGKIELSSSPTSQIGTAQPTSDVQCRVTVTATAGPASTVVVPLNWSVVPFQSIYIHQTGAANLGNVTLY